MWVPGGCGGRGLGEFRRARSVTESGRLTSPNGEDKIHAIYRYPVKGLTPEPLPRTRLAAGETVPVDRLYAIENGPSGFDPAAPGTSPSSAT